MSPSEEDEAEVARDNRAKSIAEDIAKAKRAVSVYEEFKHPNEEEEAEDVDPGLLDKDGNRVGWTGSKFYIWFS